MSHLEKQIKRLEDGLVDYNKQYTNEMALWTSMRDCHRLFGCEACQPRVEEVAVDPIAVVA